LDDLLPSILIGSIFEGTPVERHRRQCEKESLFGGVEKETLVSGVTTFNMAHEDPIV
jgi:hypothetical protein